jgi:single-stranded-DNA-specific exonuclease
MIERQDHDLRITWDSTQSDTSLAGDRAVDKFLASVRENKFQQRYFAEVPLSTILNLIFL